MATARAEAMDRSNRSLYQDQEVVRFYATREFLYPVEKVLFARLADRLRGARLLDLGVGTGRTTPFLLELTDRYVGGDYSEEMIARCRARFPGVDFRVCDARDMSLFAEGSFDVVFFSIGGIDHLDHDERQQALSEVRRVLRPGGLFLFSSLNLHSSHRKPPYRFRPPTFSPNPLRLVRDSIGAAVRYVEGIANYRRTRRFETRGDGWALLPAHFHEYRLVLHYIDPGQEVRELAGHGFTGVEAFAFDGSPIPDPDRPQDDWAVHFTAFKP